MITAVQQQILRRFVPSIVVLFFLLMVGVVGFRWLEGMTFIDALYMTVITLSTVGFGEVKPLSSTGRLFTIGLIVGGGSLAAYTVGSIGQFFLSGEWSTHWNQQRKIRMLKQLSNHIIVCGYGRVGRNVVIGLKAEGLPFVVIDPKPEPITQIEEIGALAIQGSAADETKLKEAGIENARGLVAAANTDAENVFIVLTARSLRPDLFIVARANFEESEPKLIKAGADRVILPYHITGRRMVTLLMRPDVASFLDEVSHAGGLELVLEQVPLLPASSLIGKTLAEAQLRNRLGITLLAVKMPNGQIITGHGAETVLQADTQLIVLGTREQMTALIKLAQG